MEKNKEWINAGFCGVDAGCLIIGDPCYLDGDGWTEEDYKKEVCSDWNDSKQIDNGKAVLVSSGYGDGEYPVYIKKQDGRVKEVKIKFF